MLSELPEVTTSHSLSFCSQILRSRGCVSAKDFQQLLGEVTLPTLGSPLHT